MTLQRKGPLFIASVDPGDLTGLAAMLVADGQVAVVHSDEVGHGYVRSEVEWLLARAPIDCERLLSVEQFVTRSKQVHTHQPVAQQLVGVVIDIGTRFRVEVVVQKPADIKKFTTNQTLKELGWWHSGGQGHANDAMRQCVRLLALRRASTYGLIVRPGKIARQR
jgi:hypothetical protein